MIDIQLPSGAHWRDSARNPRFFIIDYRATFPLLALIFNPTWWTLYLTVGAVIFFVALEYYGFTVPVFFRWIRSALGGPRKESYPWWLRHN
ncbi:MAG: IcmT/TraK family protein [Gammaproteobacteria bacterium]